MSRDYKLIDIYYTTTSSSNTINEMLKILSEEESAYYHRTNNKRRQKEYLYGRYYLRILLSEYLKTKPKKIQFKKKDSGKLYIDPPAPIEFNISHSGEMIAWVITTFSKAGIDIQKIKNDITNVGFSFFTPREIKYIKGKSIHLQNKLTYKLWTRKEAYIKAKGSGLEIPLDSFSVLKNTEYAFHSFQPKPEYYLSVALEQKKKPKPTPRIYEILQDQQLTASQMTYIPLRRA